MNRTALLSIAALFLISACGGGSGGGRVESPDPSLEITSNNAMQVATIAYEASLESQQLGDAGGGFFFIGSVPSVFSKSDGSLATSAKTGGSVSQVPIPPETIPCAVSGSTTISGEIKDPIGGILTAGDFFQFEYTMCDDGLGEVKNGIVRTDIDAFNGDLLSELFSMTLTFTLDNFQVSIFENQSTVPTDVLTSNGSVTISTDTTNQSVWSTTINGESFVVDTNASSESLTNFASALTLNASIFPSPYTTTASGTLDSTRLAGVIRYSNPVMFEGFGSDYPSSGEFLVEGLGSTLRLIADNNVDVRILIDVDADGTVDETINTTWASLTALQ